ncbi:unnamed protein product [Lactuca virosa]|uniref:Uncharacterized protein n=2 Tax=Lactuca virosa TaxID=75947 RepID=A0AAU9LTP3_9ASTR|nr:unnamed protein product [Lactuca virosa]
MSSSGMCFTVEVIDNVVVGVEEPWNDHWLPFTNLDLLVPPFDIGFFFCFKKTSNESFSTVLSTLKASLSRSLAVYYALAGDIIWNQAVGENQIHCNYQGVDFITATADLQLKELNFYNPNEIIEGRLMPKKSRAALAIQVTELKCGGIVIGCIFDHRIVDGYSADMFISSWADITRTGTPSMFPSLERSYLNPRRPPIYSSSIDNVFAPFLPPSKTVNDQNDDDGDHLLVNRIYYVEGEQIKRLQLLASENGCMRSKVKAFTSFLWKKFALSVEDSGKHNAVCNMAVPVDGRRRLRRGGWRRERKLMASYFGNVLSMPYGSKKAQELRGMSLADVALEVHEFLQTATNKEHFLELIDWVAEKRPQPLISKAFAGEEMSVMVSAGQRFHTGQKRWKLEA